MTPCQSRALAVMLFAAPACTSERFASLPGPAWSLSKEPTIDIGTVDGPEPTLFSRIVHVARVRDGRILVIDEGAVQVRVFGADGRFLFALGRKGRGPGEYQSPTWVAEDRSGRLLVWDGGEMGHTLLRFSPSGSFLDQYAVRGARGGAEPVRVLADGSIALIGYALSSAGREIGDSVQIGRYVPGGTRMEHVATFHGPLIMLDFMPHGVQAVGDSVIYVAESDRFTIYRYGLDGQLRDSIARTAVATPVTEEDIARFKKVNRQRIIDRYGEAHAADYDLQLARMKFPPVLNYFEQFKVDDVGALWVNHGALLDLVDWSVFAPTGVVIGTLRMPVGFWPVQMGQDFVLGTTYADDGVAHVRMYTLTRR